MSARLVRGWRLLRGGHGRREPVSAASQALRLLVGGQFVSNIGDGMYAVALPWYVLSHHGGAVLLATVLAAYGVPRTALIMVGGQLADRFGPWPVMMAADFGRLAAAGTLAGLAVTQPPELLTLMPVAFCLGAGEGLFLPASFAIMPSLVSGADLQRGNALLSAATQVAAFTGPAAGGVVVAAVGSAVGFGLDAVSFAVSALTLLLLGRVVVASGASRVAGAAVVTSGVAPAVPGLWEFIRRQRVVLLILAINIVANLGGAGASEVALPVFARVHLHAAAGGYGALVAGAGAGAMVGSLVAMRVQAGLRPAVAACLVFIAQAIVLAVLPWAPGLVAAVAMVVLSGGLNMWANITTQTAFQRWAPPGLLGRLSGILLAASYGMFPVSVALAGVVVHRAGPGAFFLLSALTLAVTLALALTRRSLRDFGAGPATGPATTPAR